MNAINVIAPYKYLDMWVFDDAKVGLTAEPFVGGADTMIDRITSGFKDASGGFVMIFAASVFPGHQFKLDWRRSEASGNVYYSSDLDAEGWLCPALLRYFSDVPEEIFVQVRERT